MHIAWTKKLQSNLVVSREGEQNNAEPTLNTEAESEK